MKLWEILIPLTEKPTTTTSNIVRYIPMHKHSALVEKVLNPSKIKYDMTCVAPAPTMLLLPDTCPIRVEGSDGEINELVTKIKAHYGVNIYYIHIGTLYTSFLHENTKKNSP